MLSYLYLFVILSPFILLPFIPFTTTMHATTKLKRIVNGSTAAYLRYDIWRCLSKWDSLNSGCWRFPSQFLLIHCQLLALDLADFSFTVWAWSLTIVEWASDMPSFCARMAIRNWRKDFLLIENRNLLNELWCVAFGVTFAVDDEWAECVIRRWWFSGVTDALNAEKMMNLCMSTIR